MQTQNYNYLFFHPGKTGLIRESQTDDEMVKMIDIRNSFECFHNAGLVRGLVRGLVPKCFFEYAHLNR